ncbi:MAG: hypothetical protein IT171_04160 [Acidobacteria bacterium]|nr:hypothetical protein [Acidobacteriota bacterium]
MKSSTTRTRSDSNKEPVKPLTHAERGRLGGLNTTNQAEAGRIGGTRSRGGGRPRKYATASERQRAYLERKKKNT